MHTETTIITQNDIFEELSLTREQCEVVKKLCPNFPTELPTVQTRDEIWKLTNLSENTKHIARKFRMIVERLKKNEQVDEDFFIHEIIEHFRDSLGVPISLRPFNQRQYSIKISNVQLLKKRLQFGVHSEIEKYINIQALNGDGNIQLVFDYDNPLGGHKDVDLVKLDVQILLRMVIIDTDMDMSLGDTNLYHEFDGHVCVDKMQKQGLVDPVHLSETYREGKNKAIDDIGTYYKYNRADERWGFLIGYKKFLYSINNLLADKIIDHKKLDRYLYNHAGMVWELNLLSNLIELMNRDDQYAVDHFLKYLHLWKGEIKSFKLDRNTNQAGATQFVFNQNGEEFYVWVQCFSGAEMPHLKVAIDFKIGSEQISTKEYIYPIKLVQTSKIYAIERKNFLELKKMREEMIVFSNSFGQLEQSLKNIPDFLLKILYSDPLSLVNVKKARTKQSKLLLKSISSLNNQLADLNKLVRANPSFNESNSKSASSMIQKVVVVLDEMYACAAPTLNNLDHWNAST
jgi:hypothetical protein